MHRLLSWVSSIPHRRQRPHVSMGLDMGSEFASCVILSGSQTCAQSLVCEEFLVLPPGLVEAGRITDTAALGFWLCQVLIERSWAIDVFSMGLDDAWITSHRVSLAQGLAQDDVLFQLMVEVQSALPDGADVCIDYRVAPLQDSASELSYLVLSTPRAFVREAQQLARAARLNLLALMSRAHANQLAQRSELSIAADHTVALGLALSAWTPPEFNFFPYRDTVKKAARLTWLRLACASCVAGACLAAVWVMTLNSMTDALQAKWPPSERDAATRAHQVAKQAHDRLDKVAQRANAQADWLAKQQGLQATTLTWHRLLGQPAPGVWVSQVTQKGTHWSVQGEALSSHHAQQWVRGWGELDLWAKPPQLPEVQLTQAVSHQGVPVWRFQVEAELKEVR
jgi:hypothetical protein